MKLKFFLSIILLFSAQAMAETHCFIVKEKNHILIEKGACSRRYSPCSTFKIPISLMGFDSGFLMDETHPTWKFQDKYKKSLPIMLDCWREKQNPKTWIKNSCIWYSQIITKKLGSKKFKQYLKDFNYGNQDISGDLGLNNGLTHAWLSSSLKISPKEQLVFLDKLISFTLPISQEAQAFTRNVLFIDTIFDDWKLYGKTGSGFLLNTDGSRNQDRQIGWFIGWLEKSERRILFVHYIQDEHKINASAGKRAKEEVLKNLRDVL